MRQRFGPRTPDAPYELRASVVQPITFAAHPLHPETDPDNFRCSNRLYLAGPGRNYKGFPCTKGVTQFFPRARSQIGRGATKGGFEL